MKLRINWLVLIPFAVFMALSATHAHAQQANASVVASCGSVSYVAGRAYPLTQSTTGLACGSSTGTVTGTVTANQGTPNAGGASAWPVVTSPTQRTLITLDVKTVTTGGTAVAAISAGHRTAGGFLQNPASATIALCINEIGTATGTTSSGDTTCIQPGQSYNVSPSAAAVSVITSDSSHPFSGYGLN